MRLLSRWLRGRKVYVDLGANEGVTVAEFLAAHPDWTIYAFEPIPTLAAKLRARFQSLSNVTVIEAAVSVEDGAATFYPGVESSQSSTLMTGKKVLPNWRVDYEAGYRVRTVDFANWLRRNTSRRDQVIVKMDIEGAEYDVLQKLIDTGMLSRCQEMRVEWHADRYPAITKDVHNSL